MDAGADDKPSLATLRGALAELPDVGYQDIKGIWETREQLPDGIAGDPDD